MKKSVTEYLESLSSRKEFYRNIILLCIPRMLNLLDRQFDSTTMGSFDRGYWSWFCKDNSNMDLQRCAYILAIVYKNNFEGNIYFNNKNILNWIISSLEYWSEKQHRNGGFDQWYTFENSVGTAAFTLSPMIKTYHLLEEKIGKQLQEKIMIAFHRSGEYIIKNDELHGFISNHKAGAALSLYRLYGLTGIKKYLDKSNELVSEIISNQSSEGWFKEYDGFDPGYESLGINYLSELYSISKNEKIYNSLKKSVFFLSNFYNEKYGLIAGELGSRNTELFFPCGFERLSEIAEPILKIMIPGVIKFNTPNPINIDVSNFAPVFENYINAYIECKENSYQVNQPKNNVTPSYFEKSGIYIYENDNYKIYINCKKGTVYKGFLKGQERFKQHAGYLAELTNGKTIINSLCNESSEISINNNELKCETNFYIYNEQSKNLLSFLLLRIIGFLLYRSIKLNNFFKKLLSNILIMNQKKTRFKFKRTFRFNEKNVQIEDSITGDETIKKIYKLDKFTPFFMGSSRYFKSYDLESKIEMNKVNDYKYSNSYELF